MPVSHARNGTSEASRSPTRVQRALGRPQVRPALFDALVLTLAMVATHASAELGDLSPPPVAWSIVFVLVTIFAMAVSGAYRPRVNVQFLDDLRTIVGATALRRWRDLRPGVAVDRRRHRQPGGSRLAVRRRLSGRRSRRAPADPGTPPAPGPVVGADPDRRRRAGSGHQVAARLEARQSSASRPVAFFDDDPLKLENEPQLPVLGAAPGLTARPMARPDRAGDPGTRASST